VTPIASGEEELGLAEFACVVGHVVVTTNQVKCEVDNVDRFRFVLSFPPL